MTKPLRLFFNSQQLMLSVILMAVLAFASCAKTEEVTIKNNVPPPDSTINDITVGNYVNRVYISVLGREADTTERLNGFNLLRKSNVSPASRSQFLDSVFTRQEYYDQLYDLARINLLNNQDTSEITLDIAIFTSLLTDSTYKSSWDGLKYEIGRLKSLQQIPNDLRSHTIDVIGMNSRCVNNFFYDQINMGSANFVISVFQHFLNRYPTKSEQANSEQMVNGIIGNLFLQSGQSKDDFMTIFFASNDYYEGAIRFLYRRFLFRDPTSVEMSAATQAYLSSNDYVKAQKAILATNEYIGI